MLVIGGRLDTCRFLYALKAIKDGYGPLYVDGDRLLGYLLCASHWGNSENYNYSFPVWGYGSI
ncbi:MAG: hypothetical protein PHE34_02205 [Tissierellia bacterium]|jgi:hypothetical protein|nr:hypothetical protein [Tissierellia bacterium]